MLMDCKIVPRLIRLFLIGSLVGFGILGVAFFKMRPSVQVVDHVGTQDASLPQIGGPFRLTDQYGNIRTSQEFRGRYMLIYFGYTYCPDVCPLGLNNISKALKLLGKDREKIVPIFVTVDPNRDTTELLKLYASNFDANFVMLTGDTAALEPLQRAYRVFSKRAENTVGMSDYLIDHSTLIYLMDPQGNFLRMFPHTTDPEKMLKIINTYLIQNIKEG